jgi:hypothetical protein
MLTYAYRMYEFYLILVSVWYRFILSKVGLKVLIIWRKETSRRRKAGEMIIIKWILEKQDREVWPGFICLRIRARAGLFRTHYCSFGLKNLWYLSIWATISFSGRTQLQGHVVHVSMQFGIYRKSQKHHRNIFSSHCMSSFLNNVIYVILMQLHIDLRFFSAVNIVIFQFISVHNVLTSNDDCFIASLHFHN